MKQQWASRWVLRYVSIDIHLIHLHTVYLQCCVLSLQVINSRVSYASVWLLVTTYAAANTAILPLYTYTHTIHTACYTLQDVVSQEVKKSNDSMDIDEFDGTDTDDSDEFGTMDDDDIILTDVNVMTGNIGKLHVC
jgi:hypothetical protein